MFKIGRFIYRKIRLINLKKDYEEVLKYLKEKNVLVMNERNFYNYWINKKRLNKPVFILRHDIDRNLKNIKTIGEIEKRYGMKSTLHIRTKNKSYDLKKLEKMNLRNFDVALHIEFDNLNDAKEDKRALERVINRKVIGTSLHGGNDFHISKNKCLNILKKIGIKYIVNFNYGFVPKKENGIVLIPCKISDIDSLSRKKIIENIELVIKNRGCSAINIHSEYL